MMCGWTIYDHPSDYPNGFIARKWIYAPGMAPDDNGEAQPTPTAEVLTASSLAELRALLPLGLICFPRKADDDPAIVESWL
jgi:hypothetical protein